MKSLTSSVQKNITEDWHNCFPELGVYRPMWLLRIVGPLAMGILLERDSSNQTYRPTFHVHNLSESNTTISLALPTILRTLRTGGPETINVTDHRRVYLGAASRLANQSPLPLKGDVTLRQVVTAYYIYLQRPDAFSPEHIYGDVALICAWAGDQKEAQIAVSKGRKSLKSPVWIHGKTKGTVNEWASRIDTQIAHPRLLHATVAQEIINHKLATIPAIDLIR